MTRRPNDEYPHALYDDFTPRDKSTQLEVELVIRTIKVN